LAILHIDAGNSSTLYDYFATRSGGIESHFFVRKDGVVEQYRDTAYEADANVKANSFYRNGIRFGAISIETQGFGEGTWTPEQLREIKLLLMWIHQTHPDVPLSVPAAWNGSGVGYHILFMTEWAGGPRSCPGPDRVKQFYNIIVPWMKNPAGTVTPPPPGGEQIVSNISAAASQPEGYSKVVESWFKDGNLVVRTESGAITPPPVVPPVDPNPGGGGTVSKVVNAGDCWVGLLKIGAVDSDSVRRLQEALNATRFAPYVDIAVTGNYDAATDASVIAHQKFLGQGGDAPGTSFVGPQQAAALFAPFPQVVVKAGSPSATPPPATQPPPPSGDLPAPAGTVYLSKLHTGQADSDSVRLAKRALNKTSFPPHTNLDDSDDWDAAMDAMVRAWQIFIGDEPDSAGSVSIGPKQSAKLFAPWAGQITVIDDRAGSQTPPPVTPPPSTGTSHTKIVLNQGVIGTPFGRKGSLWSLGIHTGDDWPGPVGEPVLSTWTAQVVGIYTSGGWGSSYGTHVITQRNDGIRESFCHLSSVTVGLNQTVVPGQMVGRIGMTGHTTGPHCHHENRKGGYGFNLTDIIKPTY